MKSAPILISYLHKIFWIFFTIPSYFCPGVIFNTENADEWGPAVSGSVASRRALIGCRGRRCLNAPGRLKAVPTGRF
jgi:hypothetical protein